ncbi:hypothetical protein NPIL_649261 [Nephila pilipes]|uniref:Uncharacterized protein n=1 Tax=Nephila pilipes TaxID=299642 RepID=A0A8X6ULQ7_NEPPI|nr:hypothetical protein NPIL_649261 [Nephila pilipes]
MRRYPKSFQQGYTSLKMDAHTTAVRLVRVGIISLSHTSASVCEMRSLWRNMLVQRPLQRLASISDPALLYDFESSRYTLHLLVVCNTVAGR